MANEYPVEIDAATGAIETLPPQRGQRYRCQLNSMADIKREMSKVYREARSGIVEISDGSKLVYMLGLVGRVIEGSDLEARVEALEGRGKNEP